MAEFIVTLRVEFDPTGAEQLKAPRDWVFFQKRGEWNRFVSNVEIISITDPVLTSEQESYMTEDWKLKNHGL